MKNIAILFASMFLFHMGRAQLIAPEVISADGTYSASSSGSISWTLGEPVSDTYLAANILTKGFHQPSSLLLNSIQDAVSGGSIHAYPNPVIAELTIDFSGMQAGTYHTEIFDPAGRLMEDRIMNVQAGAFKEKIDMNNYADGLYLIKITSSLAGGLKLFRVTKQK